MSEDAEQTRDHFRRNANSRILYLEAQQHIFGGFRFGFGAKGDGSVPGKLDGVGSVVRQRLLESSALPARLRTEASLAQLGPRSKH